MMKVNCPVCKREIDLVDHPTNPARLVAYCDCRAGQVGVVAVYETDKPAAKVAKKDGE